MKTTFEKAREFIYRNARPLDLARFQYHFENGSKEAVIKAISYYQNEDGGCGHAIEADCWNPNSTPLHTGGASDIIREIDFTESNHPVIQGILKWYASEEAFDGKVWSIVVESNNDYPHAPWWHTDSISTCHTDYNGTAQIAGFIVRYAEPGSETFELGLRIVREAIAALSPEDLEDMHTCACYIRMKEYIEKANLTNLIPYEEFTKKLHEAVHKLICMDISKWGSYVCKPSAFLSSKDSEYYLENKDIADYQCEYIVNTQLEDGSWNITWNWEEYPDEWAVSKNWWKSQVIIENLLYLKGFGRI